PEGNSPDRFLLGRLARINADLRVLPHLRRQNGNVRHDYPPARLCDVCDLVCDGGGAFALPVKRHAEHLLHVWRAVYSAVRCATWPEHYSWRSHFCVCFVRGAFCPDLGRRASAKSGETCTAGDQHRILVVLQQSGLKHSCWDRVVRGFSRRPILVSCLDLQSQSGREGQQHWGIHAIRFPEKRLAGGALCWPGFCLWLSV